MRYCLRLGRVRSGAVAFHWQEVPVLNLVPLAVLLSALWRIGTSIKRDAKGSIQPVVIIAVLWQLPGLLTATFNQGMASWWNAVYVGPPAFLWLASPLLVPLFVAAVGFTWRNPPKQEPESNQATPVVVQPVRPVGAPGQWQPAKRYKEVVQVEMLSK